MCNCKELLEKQYSEMYTRNNVPAITTLNYFSHAVMTVKPFIKRKWRTYGVGLSEKPIDDYAIRPTLEPIKFNYCPICGEKIS